MNQILEEAPTLRELLTDAHEKYMRGDLDEKMYFENEELNIRIHFPQIVALWEEMGLVKRQ